MPRRSLISTTVAAILVGCLVAPPGVFAVSSKAKEIEPLFHSSPVGTLTLTGEGDSVSLRFQSASGRAFSLTVDKRTGISTIEGLQFRAHSGQFTVSYKGQVVEAVSDSEGKLSDADVASVAYLLSVWREETGIGPDLVAAQIAMHQLMAHKLKGSQIHPLDACTSAVFNYEAAAFAAISCGLAGPFSIFTCIGALFWLLSASDNMYDACGYQCYDVTGFEGC